MIGWLARHVDQRTEQRAGRILAALEDGQPHYVYADLDRRSGITAAALYAPLARLEQRGLVESGWADLGNGRRRRWYRLKETP